jgi:HAD superfamily hydrolase (TIGR01490 family)
MGTSKTLVVFDFCETLVDFQSADRFIQFVLKDESSFWSVFSKIINKLFYTCKIYSVFNKINPKLNLSKRIILFGLRGVSEQKISESANHYLQEVILPNLNSDIVNYLQSHKVNGDILLLSSGGYHPYLELFKGYFTFDYLMCSKIELKNKKATGFLDGTDCMYEHKLTLLNNLIHKHQIKYNKIITYTDSITDKPLLKFSDIGYVVSYNAKRDWVEKEEFKEIIVKR